MMRSSLAAQGQAWAAVLLLAAGGSSLAAADTLLVVRKTGDAVDWVDPGSGRTLATVPVGHGPHEISVSPDGKQAVVSNYGSRERPGTTLSVLDLAEPREIKRIDLAPDTRPHGVAWFAPERIAVTTEGSQRVLLVDPAAARIVSGLDTGQDISHMVVTSADGQRGYVTNIGSGSTTVLDLAAGRKLADVATGKGSEALALTPDGRELWVAARAAGEIAIVDTQTLQVTARLPLAGIPIRIAMSPDGRVAYVTCAGSSELVAFEVATRRELARRKVDVPFAAGAEQRPLARLAPGSVMPIGLEVARDGRSVFVAVTMGDRVMQYDATTLAPLRVIEVGGEPDGLDTTPVLPSARCHACSDGPSR